ncbi:MAG TPA: SlyX family protein [Polyangia bacterium]|nr:SlyX family protein [Polyangia bacterium]
MESRLTDLEIRYTHLERQVAELSEVVFAQQRTIDGLLRQLTATAAEIAQLSAPVTNEKPPHY